MNGIIYCRVSSKEQMQGTSLESQRLACEEYARAKRIKISKVFVEQGESAKFADRTELLNLVEFCRKSKGQVEVLLVWKVDRFARNVADHFNIKATLAKHGVRIVSVTEPIDANPEGKLMETILAGFAQFDNDVRAMRTVQGMRRKVQEGLFPWNPPLGYKSSSDRGEKKNEPDRPDQPLFGLIQKAWRELATGGYTKAEIRRLMESWGVTTRRGSALTPQGIDYLFRNPYYAGILVDPWSHEEHQGLHVPMVSPEDFARVQQIINRRNRSEPHHKHRPEFPLRGLIRCHQCRHVLTASFSRGRSRRYPYYHCSRKECSRRGKGLAVDVVEEEFKEYLRALAPKVEVMQILGTMLGWDSQKREAVTNAKQARARRVLDGLNRELQELIRMRAQNLISDAEFQMQRSLLSERRTAREIVAEADGLSTKEIQQKLRDITGPLNELPKTWSALPDSDRSRFQRLMFPVGFITGNIRTAELGLFLKTLGRLSTDDTSEVAPTYESWNQITQEIKGFWDVLNHPEESENDPKSGVRRRRRK